MCFFMFRFSLFLFFFFFNDTATTEIYTLSLHDALPIFLGIIFAVIAVGLTLVFAVLKIVNFAQDRKSTRLNSSHLGISYAVFCLKKKKKKKNNTNKLSKKTQTIDITIATLITLVNEP